MNLIDNIMAFITKSAIQSSFDSCTDMLDQFGDREMRAARRVIHCLDQRANIKEDVDRVALFVYLSRLKNNEEREMEEDALRLLFHQIHIAFSAIYFTQYEYTKPE